MGTPDLRWNSFYLANILYICLWHFPIAISFFCSDLSYLSNLVEYIKNAVLQCNCLYGLWYNPSIFVSTVTVRHQMIDTLWVQPLFYSMLRNSSLSLQFPPKKKIVTHGHKRVQRWYLQPLHRAVTQRREKCYLTDRFCYRQIKLADFLFVRVHYTPALLT